MKTTITMTPAVTDKFINIIASTLRQPVAALANYYSGILERQVSCRQTLMLLHAQAAFFVTVFSSCNLVLRIVSIAWLITTLLQCRAEFRSAQSMR